MKSRVPELKDADPSLINLLDAMDRRQLRVSEIEDVAASPTVEQLATALNAILAAHRTR